jgi:allantoicase
VNIIYAESKIKKNEGGGWMDGWMSKEEEEEEKSFVLIDFWFES